MIFTTKDKVYTYAMNHASFSVVYKAWVFTYGNIFAHTVVRNAFLQSKISWLNDRFLVEDESWTSMELPECLQGDTEKNVEFWSYVKLFADLVLKSPVFSLSFNTPGSDKGFGLKCRKNTDSLALSSEIFGLMEPLNSEQYQAINYQFKYKSMILKNGDEKCIFFGPLSLANNDNNSQLQFIDTDYVTDEPLYIKLRVEHRMMAFNLPSTIVSVVRHRIARVHTNRVVIYLAGEDICVWYRDKDFVDMTNDTSSDEEGVDSGSINSKAMKSMSLKNKAAPALLRGQPTLASAFKRRRAKAPATPAKKRSSSGSSNNGRTSSSSALDTSSSTISDDYVSSTASSPVVLIKVESVPTTTHQTPTSTPEVVAHNNTPATVIKTEKKTVTIAARRRVVVPDSYAQNLEEEEQNDDALDDDETQMEFSPVLIGSTRRVSAASTAARPTKPNNTSGAGGQLITGDNVDEYTSIHSAGGIYYQGGRYIVQSSQEPEDSSSNDSDSTYEGSDDATKK